MKANIKNKTNVARINVKNEAVLCRHGTLFMAKQNDFDSDCMIKGPKNRMKNENTLGAAHSRDEQHARICMYNRVLCR